MTVSNEKKRICLCYFLFIFCYTLLSLLLFDIYGGFHYKDGVPSSRPYKTEIGMFSLHEEIHDKDGIANSHIEITGYIMEIRIMACYMRINNGSCSFTYREYPPTMTFVYVALFWNQLLTLFIFTPTTVIPLFSTKRMCNMKERTLDRVAVISFIFTCVVHVMGYVMYVFDIGRHIGFSWNNLTYVVKIGLANATLSPLIFLVLILLYRKKHKGNMENGLAYVKYKKIRLKTVRSGHYSSNVLHTADTTQGNTSPKCSETIYHPLDSQCVAEEIQNMIRQLWKPAKVGIGRDAKGLYHSSVNIIEVKSIGNKAVFRAYSQRKRVIQHFASSVGGKLTPPEKYPTGTSPIQTALQFKSGSNIGGNVDCDVNEHYLFHGTPVSNIESIQKYGFFMEKYKHSMLGKGIYFTEDPVKADQYTGKNNDVSDDASDPLCCMILCRVLLGDSVIQRRHVKNPTITSTAISAPCKSCLKTKPHCNCRKSIKFDSVIFEGLLFREFVVYETCLCFPEFAVLYKRVKSKASPMYLG